MRAARWHSTRAMRLVVAVVAVVGWWFGNVLGTTVLSLERAVREAAPRAAAVLRSGRVPERSRA